METVERRDSIKKSAKKKAIEIARLVKEKKAEEVVVIDVSSVSSIADYILICTVGSERQVQSVSRHIEEEMEKKGIHALNIEGFETGRWILMDYADVIAHVFLDEVRTFYDIEGLWIDCPRLELTEEKKAG